MHFKKKDDGALISFAWPRVHEDRKDKKAFTDLQVLIDVITAIRRLRTEQNVEPGKEIDITIVSRSFCTLLESQESHIRRLCKIGHLTFRTDSVRMENAASAFLPDIEVHLSLQGLFDPEKMKASLLKEQADLQQYIQVLHTKLANKNFVDRAPKELVDAEKAKLTEATEKIAKIELRLQELA